MGGRHYQDGRDLTLALNESQAEIKFLALLVAPAEPEFSNIGNAALGVIGPSQWEPQVSFSPESIGATNTVWFGPLGETFFQAYVSAYDEEPSYHSIGGYAAGLILQKAIIDAGTTNTEAVINALERLDILTCYGHIKFDTSEENHGLQIGHDMVYIQWQQENSSDFVKQVVWPPGGATAGAVYPIP